MSLVLSWLPLSAAGHAYLGIVLGVFAGTIGIPVPEEVPLLTAGVLAALGVIDLRVAILVGLASCFLGDLAVFATGRRIGFHLEGHPRIARIVRGRGFQKARGLYVDHGPWTLFIARMLPGVKTPFLFTAGAMRMPWRRFLAFDLGSVLVLVPSLVLIGYHSSWSLARLTKVIGEVGLIAAVLFVLALASLGVVYYMRRKRRIARVLARRNGLIKPPRSIWTDSRDAAGRPGEDDADAPARVRTARRPR